jgi:signal transduction histidine kinase
MMQVISNLIANAILAMPTGGMLSVSVCDAKFPEDGVVLTLADDGVGIPADVLPKLFEAFFTTRDTVGTGIGLFVAKQFVEGHGGQLTIDSHIETERRGTRVRVFLPAQTKYEASAS